MVTIGNPEVNGIIILIVSSILIAIAFLVDWDDIWRKYQRRIVERDLERIKHALKEMEKNNWDICDIDPQKLRK